MNCQEFSDLWNARLDRRSAVDAEVEHALEAHAAGCPDCRTRGAQFLLLSRAIESLPPVQVPAGFAEGCLRTLGQTEAVRLTGARVWLRRLAVPVALAACLVVGALVVLRLGGPAPAPKVVDDRGPDGASLPDALVS